MIDDRRVLGLIPARAGSAGLPGKNVRPLAGRPLVGWTIDAGLASTVIDRLVVSTDDPAVAAVARVAGVEVIDRPAELASATASVIDAVAHALTVVGGDWDYLVLLQPTSPLRTAADIDGAVGLCHARGAPAVIGVSPMLKPQTFYGRVDPSGVLRADAARPDEPVLINGAVYVGRPDLLLRERTFQSPGVLAWTLPPERGWDIDTLFDFLIAETLHAHGPGLDAVRR